MITHIINHRISVYKIQSKYKTETVVWMNSSRVNGRLVFYKSISRCFDFIPCFKQLSTENQRNSVCILLSGLLC